MLDTFWRADEMLMTNHQSGDATLLAWSRLHGSRTVLQSNDFSASALKR